MAHDSIAVRPVSVRIVLTSALTTTWTALAAIAMVYLGHTSPDASLLLIALLLV